MSSEMTFTGGRQVVGLGLALVLWASLFTRLSEDALQSGQVAKPAFSIEMAESFRQGTNHGLYPLRRFIELEFEGPSLWAEEFPLYTGTLGGLGRLVLGRDVGSEPAVISGMVILGRALSLLAVPFFLMGLFRWVTVLGVSSAAIRSGGPWVALAIAGSFPVFRLYANHIMPDFWMITAGVWTWVFATEKKWKSAFFMAGLACLIKFYAAFSMFSIAAGWCFSLRSQDRSRKMKIIEAGVLIASVAPVLIYLAHFLLSGIPNPILQYMSSTAGNMTSGASNHGHFASGAEWTRLSFYSRMITWLVVKNTGIVVTILAALGVKSLLRSPHRTEWLLLLLGQVLYVFVFSASFYVHDYYGIQFALVTWVAAIFGFAEVCKRKSGVFPLLLLLLICGEGLVRTRSASRSVSFYPDARSLLLKNTADQSRGILIGDRYLEAILYSSGNRVTWRMPVAQWNDPQRREEFVSRLKTVNWVSLFWVDSNDRRECGEIRGFLEKSGFLQSVSADLENAKIEIWERQ